MCAMIVSKLMSTCGNNSCASGDDGRCASNGAFSTGGARRLRAFVHYRATIALSAIVACCVKTTGLNIKQSMLLLTKVDFWSYFL